VIDKLPFASFDQILDLFLHLFCSRHQNNTTRKRSLLPSPSLVTTALNPKLTNAVEVFQTKNNRIFSCFSSLASFFFPYFYSSPSSLTPPISSSFTLFSLCPQCDSLDSLCTYDIRASLFFLKPFFNSNPENVLRWWWRLRRRIPRPLRWSVLEVSLEIPAVLTRGICVWRWKSRLCTAPG
jgi:hypothetical protein